MQHRGIFTPNEKNVLMQLESERLLLHRFLR